MSSNGSNNNKPSANISLAVTGGIAVLLIGGGIYLFTLGTAGSASLASMMIGSVITAFFLHAHGSLVSTQTTSGITSGIEEAVTAAESIIKASASSGTSSSTTTTTSTKTPASNSQSSGSMGSGSAAS